LIYGQPLSHDGRRQRQVSAEAAAGQAMTTTAFEIEGWGALREDPERGVREDAPSGENVAKHTEIVPKQAQIVPK